MQKNTLEIENGLQISLEPILLSFVILSVALFMIGEMQNVPFAVLEYSFFSINILTAITWFLSKRWLKVSRWALILILLNFVYLTNLWLGAPGLLAFITIPVILAIPLINFRAALIIALLEIIAIVLFSNQINLNLTTTETGPAILSILVILAIVYLIYYRINHFWVWVQEYFDNEYAKVEANRAYRMERAQMIEDLAHANQNLTRLNLYAQDLRRQAEESRLAKEQFVANVSHELRTPLNMITGFSETMLNAPDLYGGYIPPKLLADLAVIHRNAEHLSNLINDVLDLSQIDAEQMSLIKEDVQIGQLITDAVVAVRPLFESKGLYLHTDIQEGLPPVFCDRTRIREVLLNLLSNGGRFTETGGVHIEAKQNNHNLVVSIADTGKRNCPKGYRRII